MKTVTWIPPAPSSTVLISSVLFALVLPALPVNAQKTMSYNVTEDTQYEVSNKDLFKNVNSQDLIEMRPRSEMYKITKIIEGNYFRETKEYLVANATESWYPDSKKIVTDNDGTKIYNSKGELIFERQHPEEIKKQIDQNIRNNGNQLGLLNLPDPELISLEAKAQNASFKKLPDGNVVIKRPVKTNVDGTYLDFGATEETEISRNNNVVKIRTIDSKNHEIKSQDTYLRQITKNEPKALKMFERLKTEHSSYANIYLTKYIRYENYELDGKRVFEENTASEPEKLNDGEPTVKDLTLYPNPGVTVITAQYAGSLKISGINIVNSFGVNVSTVILGQENGVIKLDISKLTPGIYSVILSHSTGTISQQFIKK